MHKTIAVLCLFFTSFTIFAKSGDQLEIITLQHRIASEITNTIEPFLAEGGTLSVFNNQLIIKTTPENLTELKALIATLDKPPETLIISVSRKREAPKEQFSFDISTNLKNDLNIQLKHQKSLNKDKSLQHIQTLSGASAFIETGVNIPVVIHHFERHHIPHKIGKHHKGAHQHHSTTTYDYLDKTEGFYVKPQIIDKNVRLELFTHEDKIQNNHYPQSNISRTQTTLTVPIGKWVYFGGTESQNTNQQHAQQHLWLRVDQAPKH